MQLRKVGNQAIRQLREVSNTQKLEVAASIVACALGFYAIGIATNFFANPIFSMFFIISYETAHSIVTYAAIGIAIALATMAIAIILTKKRKRGHQETLDKHIIRTIKTPIETPAARALKIAAQPSTIKSATTNQELFINQDKITCPNCKKEVSRPIYVEDYSGLLARVVRLCPHCNQPIDAQIANPADEEIYNKHVLNY